MNCPNCQTRFTEMGCTVESRPLHWCPGCGTIRTCDGDEARPGNTPRIVKVGILLATGLHDAFEGVRDCNVPISDAADMVLRTPIEKSVEMKGRFLWDELVRRDEIPPYHPEQEEPL